MDKEKIETIIGELPWHDAVIVDIRIDRSNPGYADTVEISIEWPNETKSTVLFCGCYALLAEVNFGVIAEESILNACVDDGDLHLAVVKSKWERVLERELDIACVRIETNSTASVWRIYAERVEILSEPPAWV